MLKGKKIDADFNKSSELIRTDFKHCMTQNILMHVGFKYIQNINAEAVLSYFYSIVHSNNFNVTGKYKPNKNYENTLVDQSVSIESLLYSNLRWALGVAK